MESLVDVADVENRITRCPICCFQHLARPDTPCATCQAKATAGDDRMVIRQDMDQHAETFHFLPPSHANGIRLSEPEPEPEPSAMLDDDVAPDTSALPQEALLPTSPPRRTGGTRQLQLQRCKYEPCGVTFLPKKAKQMFHSIQCSSRWRMSQQAGQDQLRRAAAARKPSGTPEAFAAQVRARCTTLQGEIAHLTEAIAAQQDILERLQKQLALLTQYSALDEKGG